MIKIERTWTAVAMLALATACAPTNETAETAEPSAETKPAPSKATDLPPAAVLIAHRVTDYDAWKKEFDAHTQARKDATCLGHEIKREIDAADVVFVYCLATDADRLQEFLRSADLAEAMKNAGVKGSPMVTMMRPMSRDLVPDPKLPGIIVMHLVEDYDRWRVAYDELDEFRRQSGIVGHAVSQQFGSPNYVVVYHQANDVAALRAFVDSAELRDTMQRAGVVGAPDIRFLRVADFASY